jgi:hypothetical protein
MQWNMVSAELNMASADLFYQEHSEFKKLVVSQQ